MLFIVCTFGETPALKKCFLYYFNEDETDKSSLLPAPFDYWGHVLYKQPAFGN